MYTTVTHDGVEDAVAIEEPLEIRIDGPRPAGLTDDFADNAIEAIAALDMSRHPCLYP